MNYIHKNNVHMTWLETKQNLRLKARQIADRVLNEVFKEASEEFIAAANEGRVLKIGVTDEEIGQRLFNAAAKLIGVKHVLRDRE